MIMNALIYGLIWAAMWSIYVFLILKYYPFSMLHDFPKDIQAATTIKKPTKAQEQSAKLKAGEITKEDYDRWRYHYPDFDDTHIHAAIPPEEPVKSKRGRKPKMKE